MGGGTREERGSVRQRGTEVCLVGARRICGSWARSRDHPRDFHVHAPPPMNENMALLRVLWESGSRWGWRMERCFACLESSARGRLSRGRSFRKRRQMSRCASCVYTQEGCKEATRHRMGCPACGTHPCSWETEISGRQQKKCSMRTYLVPFPMPPCGLREIPKTRATRQNAAP